MTKSATDFEALAVKLAKDPAALEKLRAKLAKDKAKAASLFDTAAFTRNLEAAYRTMWQALAGRRKGQRLHGGR